MARRGWQVRNLNEADEAWALAQAIDGRLAPWAKTSWRWRILYIRAAIDHVLKTREALDPQAQAALKPLCDELVRIYHAEATFIRPPAFPEPPSPRTAGWAGGCPITASSTHPDYPGSERKLMDGILSAEDPDNFWVSDPAKERTARLLIDLGKSMPIKEVRLQFRGIHGDYWFIPSTIGVEVSEDGKAFQSVVCPTAVPKEGTPYSRQLWTCAVGKRGRYVRVNLGLSQHTNPPFAGTLELTEIQVLSL